MPQAKGGANSGIAVDGFPNLCAFDGPLHVRPGLCRRFNRPVILTKSEEIDVWLSAPAEEALKLQWPLDAGVLKVVEREKKKDGDDTS